MQLNAINKERLIELLRKPNVKKCSFTEYQCWVMTNFLFCTAVRQRSLRYLKVKDIDFDNNVVYLTVTKNRKSLIVPFNRTMFDFEPISFVEYVVALLLALSTIPIVELVKLVQRKK